MRVTTDVCKEVTAAVKMSSRTLTTVGRRDIGLRSFWIEEGGWTLGIATTSVDIIFGGKNPSLRDALKTAVSLWDNSWLKSQRNQFGMPSGPRALSNLMLADVYRLQWGGVAWQNQSCSRHQGLLCSSGRPAEMPTTKLINSVISRPTWTESPAGSEGGLSLENEGSALSSFTKYVGLKSVMFRFCIENIIPYIKILYVQPV